MRRALVSMVVLLVALAAAQNLAAQRKGAGVLSGVVLGPDDKPVPHASVTYQSSAGIAPHAVRADSQGHFTISKLRSDNYDLRASGEGVFSECDGALWADEVGDAAIDLREGDSEGLYEEQGEAVAGRIVTECMNLGSLVHGGLMPGRHLAKLQCGVISRPRRSQS